MKFSGISLYLSTSCRRYGTERWLLKWTFGFWERSGFRLKPGVDLGRFVSEPKTQNRKGYSTRERVSIEFEHV